VLGGWIERGPGHGAARAVVHGHRNRLGADLSGSEQAEPDEDMGVALPLWRRRLPDGADCAFSDQCCSGTCSPDGSGNLVSSGACIPTSGACTTDSDCCGGYCDTQSLTCLDNGGVD
jgi:hypothetical protein